MKNIIEAFQDMKLALINSKQAYVTIENNSKEIEDVMMTDYMIFSDTHVMTFEDFIMHDTTIELDDTREDCERLTVAACDDAIESLTQVAIC